MDMKTSKFDGTGSGKERACTMRALTYYLLSATVESLIVVILFLNIPVDPKNVSLWGYSKSRLGFITLFLFVALLSILGTIRLWRNAKWQGKITKKINAWVEEYRWQFPIMTLLFGIIILGPYMYLLLKGPVQGSLYRMFPLILFAITRALQTLIVHLSLAFTRGKPKPAAAQNERTILLNPGKMIMLLVAFAALLVLASISGELMNQILPWDQQIDRYIKKFALDSELSFPTYFSSFILLFSAFLLAVIAGIKQRAKDSYTLHWVFLAIICLFMSLDETVTLHEYFIKLLRSAYNPTGVFYFAWVIIAIPIVIIIAAAYRKFILHLPTNSRILFLTSAGLYLTGAIGLEMVGGWYYSMNGSQTLSYIFVSSMEETLEIAGILTLIHALLRYIGSHFPEVRFRLSDPG